MRGGIGMRPGFGGRLATALAGVGCVLALSACGTSSKPNSSASSNNSTLVRYADCMRSHGVPDFPDPLDGGFPLRTSGINLSSPAFASAQQACASLQPGGSAEPAPITGEQLYEMAKKAQCIREHGFPNFPDPTLAAGGHAFTNRPPSGWSPYAPASRAASKACADVGITIPGWGDPG